MKRSTPKDVESRKRDIICDNKEPKAPRKSAKEGNRANRAAPDVSTDRSDGISGILEGWRLFLFGVRTVATACTIRLRIGIGRGMRRNRGAVPSGPVHWEAFYRSLI